MISLWYVHEVFYSCHETCITVKSIGFHGVWNCHEVKVRSPIEFLSYENPMIWSAGYENWSLSFSYAMKGPWFLQYSHENMFMIISWVLKYLWFPISTCDVMHVIECSCFSFKSNLAVRSFLTSKVVEGGLTKSKAG